MQFNNSTQAIYLQIVDYICEKILLKEWIGEDKIPSVRELAIEMEVNPNTVMRSYDYLKQLKIIFDKRGIGYFITDEGFKLAQSYRKQEFTKKELPSIFRAMYLLDVDLEDLKTKFERFKQGFSAKN